MTRVELAPAVMGDFDRIEQHLIAAQHPDPAARVLEILRAFDVLRYAPMIGRPVSRSLRELVIGYGAHGYVARYRYILKRDLVVVVSVRSQREAGYRKKRGP